MSGPFSEYRGHSGVGNFPLDCLGPKEYFLIDCYSCVACKPTNITPNLLDWSMKMNSRKVPIFSFQRGLYPLEAFVFLSMKGERRCRFRDS